MAYRKILVPVDGSATASLGLREAIRLAKDQDASLELLHVVDQHFVLNPGMDAGVFAGDMLRSLRESGHAILKKAEAAVARHGLRFKSVMLETMTRPAADMIVRHAKRSGADLIVIGTHGRRGIRRLLMGSDAEQVVRTSPLPVLLVRGKEASPRRSAR